MSKQEALPEALSEELFEALSEDSSEALSGVLSETQQADARFFDRVYAIVARIPQGYVVSYGQIAALLGAPRAARTVGWALSACPEKLPWQRVVRADGSVTGGDWAALRRELLACEGITFLPDGRVNMARHAWKPE